MKIRTATSLATLLCLSLVPATEAATVDGSIRITGAEVEPHGVVVSVEARNTGSEAHSFPVGCSLQARDGSWLDVPHQVIELDPDQRQRLAFSAHDIDPDAYVLVRVAIWDHEKQDGLLDTRYDMDERDLR